MNLTHFKPFGGVSSVQNGINRFFDTDFFKDYRKIADSFTSWYPATDVFETKESYIFKVEVPGMSKDDIQIEFADNTLTIKGTRKFEQEVKDENYHRIERNSGSFSRSFTLPGETDSNKISAAMKDGILELQIPKAEEKIAKSIPIVSHD
jgi:HSP20 family protein